MREKMKNDNMRRLILTLLLSAFIFSLCVPFVSAAQASGIFGNGLVWALNGNGVLTVSGYGEIPSYNETNPAPWHAYREDIRVIKVENGISAIGSYAFYGLSEATVLTLPTSVKTIGDHAFYQCSALKNINFSSGLIKIGASAFEHCEALKTFRLPSTLKTIEKRAFYRCYSLQTVSIPSSVTKIGNMTFAYCSGLISADIRASISSLPTWMFYDCQSLTTVVLSDNISHVESKAFYLCNRLSDVSTIERNADSVLSDIRDTSLPDFDADCVMTTPNPTTDRVVSSDVEMNEDTVTITTTTVTTTENSTVSSTVSKETEYTITEDKELISGESQVSVKIDAVIEHPEGWNDLIDEIQEGEKEVSEKTQIKVDVSLHTEKDISADILNALAGKNVQIKVDMDDGSAIQIDCERLEKDGEGAVTTTISYLLTQNENPTKNHIKTIGNAKSFLLSFDGSTSFDFSPKIYVGKTYAYQTATLYQYIPGRGLSLLQSVKVDKDGFATYYLQSTKDTTQYLIALNVKDVNEDSVILPEDMAAEYGDMFYYETIEYVTTGVRLFMGLSLFQFGFVVLGVMAFLFAVVGIVMSVLYRKKKLELYYQQLKAKNA